MLLLSMMLEIYHHGITLIESGVPVQQLMELPLLAQARRLKSTYRSDEIVLLNQFGQTIRETFNQLRIELVPA